MPWIPVGEPQVGPPGTIDIGEVKPLAAGATPYVTISGPPAARKAEFGIPIVPGGLNPANQAIFDAQTATIAALNAEVMSLREEPDIAHGALRFVPSETSPPVSTHRGQEVIWLPTEGAALPVRFTYRNLALLNAPATYLGFNGNVTDEGASPVVITGTPTYGPGVGAGAQSLAFSGGAPLEAKAPQFPNVGPFGLAGSTSFTVECVVNFTTTTPPGGWAVFGQTGLFSFVGSPNGDVAFELVTSTGANNFGVTVSRTPVNRAIHLLTTWDGTTLTLYIDGQPAASSVTRGTVAATSTNSLFFGSRVGGTTFTGRLGGVAIYKNKVLTRDEIRGRARAAGVAQW